ncbi:outer membrane protein [Aquabacter cavernae]|uniref:outer membrane protein n=1 Tax=Aquabacter cavernae TaxID=2496029 RepID=UPI0013E02737|nr:outer membrane beta-barrel protein [Aquabacter cavernae]
MQTLFRFTSCAASAAVLSSGALAADPGALSPGRPGDFTLTAPAIEETVSDGGWYVRVDAGGSRLASGTGTIGTRSQPYGGPGWTAGVGLGYRFTPHFRADVTADFISHSRLQEKVFLANAYWDLFTIGRVTPYVGVGVGAGEVSLSSSAPIAVALPNLERYDWQAAWSFVAGASWAITPAWTLNAGYRFIDLGSPTFDIQGRPVDLVMSGIREQQFRLGLRYALK